jgi:hypothetical protein
MYYRKRKRPQFNTDDLVKQFMDKGGEVKTVSPVFGVDKEFDKKLSTFYQSVKWRGARDYVFAHNPNECAYCGTVDKLQIDHIRPLRHNWDLRLVIDNLQILCEDCNYKKGSNPDYRYHSGCIAERKRILAKEAASETQETVKP